MSKEMDMVERVARAIAKSRGDEDAHAWFGYVGLVFDIFEEMRKPTAMMIAAEALAHDWKPEGITAGEAWEWMMDAAMVEGVHHAVPDHQA